MFGNTILCVPLQRIVSSEYQLSPLEWRKRAIYIISTGFSMQGGDSNKFSDMVDFFLLAQGLD